MAEVDAGQVTPVETVASPDAPAPESTADQVTEAPEGGTKPEAAPDEPKLTQAEVNKIVAKRVAQASRQIERAARAEAEAAYLRQQLEAQRQPQHSPNSPAGELKPTDFPDYESFMRAQARQEARQEFEARERDRLTQERQRAAVHEAEMVRHKIASVSDEIPDIEDALLAEDFPMTQPMAAYVQQMDLGPKAVYQLHLNRAEFKRISALPPVQQIIELHKLESKLAGTPAPTRTPAPIVPNPTKATVDKDPSKMSDKEFTEWRRRQIAQRR